MKNKNLNAKKTRFINNNTFWTMISRQDLIKFILLCDNNAQSIRSEHLYTIKRFINHKNKSKCKHNILGLPLK